MTRGELVARYQSNSYPALVSLLKAKRVGVIPSSRRACIDDLVDIKMKEFKVKNPITPERVKKFDVIRHHKCECQDGEYKEKHSSCTVLITLDNGKTKEIAVCQNTEGLSISKKIDDIRLWNNKGSKRKSYITHAIWYPIQHWIAREINIYGLWEY